MSGMERDGEVRVFSEWGGVGCRRVAFLMGVVSEWDYEGWRG